MFMKNNRAEIEPRPPDPETSQLSSVHYTAARGMRRYTTLIIIIIYNYYHLFARELILIIT